jgi:hypothetical protein
MTAFARSTKTLSSMVSDYGMFADEKRHNIIHLAKE